MADPKFIETGKHIKKQKVRIVFRVTYEEKKLIEEKASSCNMFITEYLNAAAFKHENKYELKRITKQSSRPKASGKGNSKFRVQI